MNPKHCEFEIQDDAGEIYQGLQLAYQETLVAPLVAYEERTRYGI